MSLKQLGEGNLRKMRAELDDAVPQYAMPLGEDFVPLNALLGQQIALNFLGSINCIHCNRLTKNSFSQGYCYPCFKRLAQCDTCIVSPQKCHYAAGTCREPAWGEANCMIDHFVYIANTSGLKVGITRGTQVPTRWIDQGATQALPVMRVSTRLDSGLAEVTFAEHVADKTAWQTMLKGANTDMDMLEERSRLLGLVDSTIQGLREERGLDAVTVLDGTDVTSISYPVIEYPTKVKSMNFDKLEQVTGKLMGIKGQYLILDTGVINIRRHAGYSVSLSAAG